MMGCGMGVSGRGGGRRCDVVFMYAVNAGMKK